MATWIGLFRGINVGGHNILPMAELRRELELLNLKNVHTYIQSGNVVFDSTAKSASTIAENIERHIDLQFGFSPRLLILRHKELQMAVERNPFPEAVSDPKSLHFFFLATPAVDHDAAAIGRAQSPGERYQLTDRVFYLHAPDGIGRSKLAANAEKYLGVVTTARNYRTVDKLLSMATQTYS